MNKAGKWIKETDLLPEYSSSITIQNLYDLFFTVITNVLEKVAIISYHFEFKASIRSARSPDCMVLHTCPFNHLWSSWLSWQRLRARHLETRITLKVNMCRNVWRGCCATTVWKWLSRLFLLQRRLKDVQAYFHRPLRFCRCPKSPINSNQMLKCVKEDLFRLASRYCYCSLFSPSWMGILTSFNIMFHLCPQDRTLELSQIRLGESHQTQDQHKWYETAITVYPQSLRFAFEWNWGKHFHQVSAFAI